MLVTWWVGPPRVDNQPHRSAGRERHARKRKPSITMCLFCDCAALILMLSNMGSQNHRDEIREVPNNLHRKLALKVLENKRNCASSCHRRRCKKQAKVSASLNEVACLQEGLFLGAGGQHHPRFRSIRAILWSACQGFGCWSFPQIGHWML